MIRVLQTSLVVLLGLAPFGSAPAQEACNWTQVPAPAGASTIVEVTAVSTTEAWAIDNDLNFDGVIRWDGIAWNEVPLPDLSGLGHSFVLHATAAPAPGLFFASGVINTAALTTAQVLLTWDGSAWDRIGTLELLPDIAGAPRHGTPHAVAGVAPDDMWLVGSAWDMGTGTGTGLVLTVHWDGSGLTEHLTPGVGNRQNHLYDAVALAADDIWAVGKYNNTGLDDYTFHGMIYHYDGVAWQHIPSPANGIDSSRLNAVAAVAPDDVWAAGSDNSGPLFLHFDGGAWSVVPGPPGASGTIYGLTATAADDVWAVDFSPPYGELYHWDGSAWSIATPDIPGAVSVTRHGGLAAAGPCDVWAVGNADFGQGTSPYIERLQAAEPSGVAIGAAGALDLDVSPNPLAGGTVIRFAAGKARPVKVDIYDARGRLVKALAAGNVPAEMRWDGRDAKGRAVPSGLYFLRATAAEGVPVIRKLVVLR